MSSSPYKKLKTCNRSWVGYISMSKLAPNKCHKMLFITETNHTQYGKGQQTTVECCDGQRFRVQLPGKYLAQLSPEDLSDLKKDMMNAKNPYLIYRETMLDNSFRMDVVEKSTLSDEHFANGTDYPELNDSVDESANANEGEDGNNGGQSTIGVDGANLQDQN